MFAVFLTKIFIFISYRPQTNDTTQPRKESTESAPSKTDMIRIETYVPPVLPSAPPVAPQPYEWEPQGESNEPDIIVTTSGYDSTEETETSPREVVKSTSCKYQLQVSVVLILQYNKNYSSLQDLSALFCSVIGLFSGFWICCSKMRLF